MSQQQIGYKTIGSRKLAATKKATSKVAGKGTERSIIQRVIKKQTSVVRRDIADWKRALQQASAAEDSRQALLQDVYTDIMLDALLSSQLGLRIDKNQGAEFDIFVGEEVDDQAKQRLVDPGLYDDCVLYRIEGAAYGDSVVEFAYQGEAVVAQLIPRAHISPDIGTFYPDVTATTGDLYRENPDFGKWVVELGYRTGDFGFLNKAVPHVLMKRFAQSCWSELCEIFGIPPRVLKTNTTDAKMLAQAERMMREIGAAAYYIIDKEENFEFAQGSTTNGDVYRNLIVTCNQEISMLVLGAMLGQDTVNGSRSKEQVSIQLLESVVLADRRAIEADFNRRILPALAAIGYMPQGARLRYRKEINVDKLWKMTHEALEYYDVDVAWVEETFGIKVTAAKNLLPASEPPASKTKKKKEKEEGLTDAETDFFV